MKKRKKLLPVIWDDAPDWRTFFWQGTPIPDIRAWARERGEKIVTFVEIHHGFDMHSGREYLAKRHREMPESFFDSLRIIPGAGVECVKRIVP